MRMKQKCRLLDHDYWDLSFMGFRYTEFGCQSLAQKKPKSMRVFLVFLLINNSFFLYNNVTLNFYTVHTVNLPTFKKGI